MNVVIAYDRPRGDAREDELDAIVQATAVEGSLRDLGHSTRTVEADLDLASFVRALEPRPDLVFNLVESLGGAGRLIGVVPLVLETLGISYTGAPADAVYATSNKLVAKRMMTLAGIPTPPFAGAGSMPEAVEGEWIIKSVWEHASIGLDDSSIVEATNLRSLCDRVGGRAAALGGEAFAERYIEGREFNLSLLAAPEGPEVLPPAEIIFEGYGPERRRIVGYSAKWAAGSYEFAHTPRRFELPATDGPLVRGLVETARRCWGLFGLRGYARVDFRVDDAGRAWVLEVNTNPCLSPDAGFQAALTTAGLSLASAVERILADARRPAGR
jgi:D-alanine-D-alanine ligase